jgi:glycosyltransferase involved in cell wall biosynthesis
MIANNEPLLTVITLTRNSSIYIEPCIRSFLGAVEKCNEKIAHLVIDGYSTDDTIPQIQALSPSSRIIPLQPTGLYNAINYTIRHEVKTPYVTYLHSDDEVDSDYLYQMMREIERCNFPNAVIVGTVAFIDTNSVELYRRKPPFYIERIQKANNLIFHPNAVYSTDLEKKFPYREDKYQRASDSYHILEIMKIAKHIRVPKAVYKFRISNVSWTFNEAQEIETQKPLFSRLYIHIFENRKVKRFLMKTQNKSFWKA